jgi:hypothetical protein
MTWVNTQERRVVPSAVVAKPPLRQFRAHAKTPLSFTVVFYGPKSFCRKFARFVAMPCKSNSLGSPIIRNAVQRCENTRKISFLNYESPALTAELQARFACGLKYSISG